MTLKFAPFAPGRLRTTTLAFALCIALSGWITPASAAHKKTPAAHAHSRTHTQEKNTRVPQKKARAQQKNTRGATATRHRHSQYRQSQQVQTDSDATLSASATHDYAHDPRVDSFIADMVAQRGFNSAALHAIFAEANYSPKVVKLVRPVVKSSRRDWDTYESRVLEPVRINAGVRFWRENRAALQRARDEFGVPPEVIVGIIGVETIYGRHMGTFRVLDALTTLAFDYPDTPNRAERTAIFRKNLEDYLVWTRDAHIDPNTVLGSYTGAIGIPQFLPSSIRQYAVDFDRRGSIDLRSSNADAIGSVANFLKQNGWEAGRPVVWNIGSSATSQAVAQANADGQPQPHLRLGQLLRDGLTIASPGVDTSAEANTPVTIIDLPTPGQPTEYKLGLKNFYVLTRYNRSFFYALSVYELGMQVKAQMAGAGSASGASSGISGSSGVSPGSNDVDDDVDMGN